MKILKKIAGLSLLAASLCLTVTARADEPTFSLSKEGQTIVFKGGIDKVSSEAVIAAFNEGANRIIITSLGGSMEHALNIAEVMQKHKIVLEVKDYCISACANFLFIAASEKKLLPDAVLGFHGGSLSSSARKDFIRKAKAIKHEFAQQMAQMLERTWTFYESVGFDDELIVISGKLTRSVPTVYRAKLKDSSEEKVFTEEKRFQAFIKAHIKQIKSFSFDPDSPLIYFPNLHMLTKYGVTGITDYPYPADQQAMDALAKRLIDQDNFDIKLIGDYVRQ
jgi:ATP-dependent protease ClpP protease subunit